MLYEIRLEKAFVKRMDNIEKLFKLSATDAKLARETIIFGIELLSEGKELPEYYYDHELEREPWSGFREFHALDDLLVVYYKIDAKKRIRMVTLTSHEELSTGRLQY